VAVAGSPEVDDRRVLSNVVIENRQELVRNRVCRPRHGEQMRSLVTHHVVGEDVARNQTIERGQHALRDGIERGRANLVEEGEEGAQGSGGQSLHRLLRRSPRARMYGEE
jgi:hypothetical protein